MDAHRIPTTPEHVLREAAETLGGEVIEYEGQQVIDLGHDNAIEVCEYQAVLKVGRAIPMGYFLEPINCQLIGVYPV